jgi:hypothetical protein
VLPRRYNVSDLPADATDYDTIAGDFGRGPPSPRSTLRIKNEAPFLTGAGSSKANILPFPNRDFQTLNGVVHAVDSVLLPPSTQRTVVDIAKGNTAVFSTLVELLTLAGLDTTLSKNDDVLTAYTVFAPTNDAFKKMDAETMACLKDPANKVSVHAAQAARKCFVSSLARPRFHFPPLVNVERFSTGWRHRELTHFCLSAGLACQPPQVPRHVGHGRLLRFQGRRSPHLYRDQRI